jgi:hypothetical protein
MNDKNKILDFNKVKSKNDIKKMINHVRLLETKKVISTKAAHHLISRIVSGKIKNNSLSNAKVRS